MMLGRRSVVVGVSCTIRCQNTHCKYVSSDLFSGYCIGLLFFRGGWAEGGTMKTRLLFFSPFLPNPHSEGFLPALRHLFAANIKKTKML